MRLPVNPLPAARIHAYAASFGDDLARQIIAEHTREGDTVLDPFVGSGTTAIQALLLGRNAIGIDIDPIAVRISRVLTTRFDVDYLARSVNAFEQQLESCEQLLEESPSTYKDLGPGVSFEVDGASYVIPEEPAIKFWFDPSHMATLGIARGLAAQETDPLVRQFFEVVVSSVIVRKWPNTLSYAMDIDHSRPHKPRVLEVQSLARQFALLRRVLRQAEKIVLAIQESLIDSNGTVDIYEADSADQLSELGSNIVEFVLTSPPYLNAIDYPRAHKFSQWWITPEKPPLTRTDYLGLRRGAVKIHARQPLFLPAIANLLVDFEASRRYRDMVQYVADLAEMIGQIHRVAKPGGKVVFVVADNVIEGKVFPVGRIVSQLFEFSGLLGGTIEKRTIKQTRRRYPFGINGFTTTMRDEYLVFGQK